MECTKQSDAHKIPQKKISTRRWHANYFDEDDILHVAQRLFSIPNDCIIGKIKETAINTLDGKSTGSLGKNALFFVQFLVMNTDCRVQLGRRQIFGLFSNGYKYLGITYQCNSSHLTQFKTTTNILYGFVYLSARVGQQVQF